MSETRESEPTPTSRTIVSDPYIRRWLLLIAVVAVAVVVSEAIIRGGYDGIAALVGAVLGVLLGRPVSTLESVYFGRWQFLAMAAPAIALWLANVIVGLLVLYPMWIFGFLFFFPVVFTGYVFLYGLVRS